MGIERYTQMSQRVKKHFSNFAPKVTKVGFHISGSKYSTLWRLEWRSPPTAIVLALWKGDTKSLAPRTKLEFTKLFNDSTWLERGFVEPIIHAYQNRDAQRVFNRVDEHLDNRPSSTIRSNSGKRKQTNSSAKLRKIADRVKFRMPKANRAPQPPSTPMPKANRAPQPPSTPMPKANRAPQPPSTPMPKANRAPQPPRGPMPRRRFKKHAPASPEGTPDFLRKGSLKGGRRLADRLHRLEG